MKLIVYSAINIGLVRKNNQDSILVDEDNGLFIVADGMGGHQGGEVASYLAVQTISKRMNDKTKRTNSPINDLKQACTEANATIYQESKNNLKLRGMGTTLCMFFCPNRKDQKSYVVNIGDSRIYMEKEDKMWLLTEDHNFITTQQKASFLSGEPMPAPSSEDNILTKSVGFFPKMEPDILEKKLEQGEKYLICSDGLSGFVPYEEIHAILKTCALHDVPGECIKKALKAGGGDNISIIAIEVQ